MEARLSIPAQLAAAVEREPREGRAEWLASLPATVADVALRWSLQVGEPYEPGGQAAWVAPAVTASGEPLALKVGWTHPDAAHEADGLRFWAGDPTVLLLDDMDVDGSTVLLLERCEPGTPLSDRPGEEQDEVVAGLLPRLWQPPPPAPFTALEAMAERWARDSERDFDPVAGGLDPALYSEGVATYLAMAAEAVADPVTLATDLHAGNVLAAARRPWLVIDPKPHVGDRHYDVLQHLLNREDDLVADPVGLVQRMAGLLDLDAGRLRSWLFARCCIEAPWGFPHAAEVAARLAP